MKRKQKVQIDALTKYAMELKEENKEQREMMWALEAVKNKAIELAEELEVERDRLRDETAALKRRIVEDLNLQEVNWDTMEMVDNRGRRVEWRTRQVR